MATTVRNVMSKDPVVLQSTEPLTVAAAHMRDADIGDVVVEEGGQLCGLVTDRDVVVRAVAERKDPASTTLNDVCSHDLQAVGPDDDVDEVVDRMRDHAIRRVPVVEDGIAIGMLSLGDLAMERDPDSALGQISGARGND